MRVTVLAGAFSRVPMGASAGSTSTFFDIQPRGRVMDNSTGEHERHAATMNYSSQKSPRPFRRSCRLQPVAPRSSAWGFCNTLHEGNEIFQTFGDRLFSLLTLEQLQSFLDSKAHLSHTVALASIVREDFNASLASSPGGTRHGSFHPSRSSLPCRKTT